MTAAQKSLFSMSLVGAIPGGILAFFGAMGGISGWGGTLMVMYWMAAVVGGILAFLPVLVITGIFPKAGRAKPKAAKAEKPAKGKDAKAAAVAEPGSEDLSVSDAPVAASDEFEAVDDDEFGSAEFGEFEEEDEK